MARRSAQLHQKLITEGGFSVREPSGRTPHRGWMVSVAGHEEATALRDFDPHDVSEYRQHHWHHLHDTRRYLGGWMNQSRHTAVLDESERHFNLGIAERRAAEEHQHAIYDLTSGRTVHTAGPGSIGQVALHPHLLNLRRGRR